MKTFLPILGITLLFLLVSCVTSPNPTKSSSSASNSSSSSAPVYILNSNSVTIIQTSYAGDRLAAKPGVNFTNGTPTGVIVNIAISSPRQKLYGIGTALTESSAYVLANLPAGLKNGIINNLFTTNGTNGANFGMTRVPMGSCDFTVYGNFSYDDTSNDIDLTNFSIACDSNGFTNALNPNYDLLQLIQDAVAANPALKIMATAWTAPRWMKNNNSYSANGSLLSNYYTTFANYYVKYIQTYQALGINIWAVTPWNEPGSAAGWEGMGYNNKGMTNYLVNGFGPILQSNCPSVKRYAWDFEKDESVFTYLNLVFANSSVENYFDGVAVHWYASSTNVYTYNLDTVHNTYGKELLQTEACIDNISNGQVPLIWWTNDSWWWLPDAKDGSYQSPYSQLAYDLNPAYVPVHRYARDIIECLNHWDTGWIDWNAVLDKTGGPDHVSNVCGAPVMVDTGSQEIYYTPIFFALAQFSRFINSGDHVVGVTTATPSLGWDDFHATAVVSQDGKSLHVFALNTTAAPINYSVQIGTNYAKVTIDSNAVQTLTISIVTNLSNI